MNWLKLKSIFQNSIYLLILILNLLQAGSLCGQKELINWTYFGNEDGFKSSTVRCFFQDRDGFMWIGTESGLYRFDGSEFKLYENDSRDSLSLGDNSIYSLLQDSEGYIWVGTNNGYSIYNPISDKFKAFKEYYDEEGLRHALGATLSLIEDNQGQIWRGSHGIGLCLINHHGTKKMFSYKNPDLSQEQLDNLNNTNKIIQDRFDDNIIWILGELGLFKFNKLTNTISLTEELDNYFNHTGNKFMDFLIDDNHIIWIGNEGLGLRKYDPIKQGFKWIKFGSEQNDKIFPNVVTSLRVKSANELWLGFYHEGLAYFNTDREELHYLNYNYAGINWDNIIVGCDKIYMDKSSNIWTNYGFGLAVVHQNNNRFDNSSFRNQFNIDDKKSYFRFLIDSVENVYYVLGTGEGFFVLDPNDNSVLPASEIVDINEEMCMPFEFAKTPNGEIWVTGNTIFYNYGTSGLFKFDKLKQGFELIPFQGNPTFFKNKQMSALFVDSEDLIWAANIHNELYCFDQKNDTAYIYSLDHPKYKREQEKIDSKSYKTVVDTFDNLPYTRYIHEFSEDPNGKIWFSSIAGLNAFDKKSNKFIRIKNKTQGPKSLASHNIKDIEVDKDGYLWAASIGSGVYRLNTNNLENDTIIKFTTQDGLLNNNIWICTIDCKSSNKSGPLSE